MDLTFSQDEVEFRDELRGWLAENSPGEEPRGDEDKIFEFRTTWQRSLYDSGWAAVHWPQEYGGRDATLMESAIFFEEMGRAGAPLPANVLGLLLAGPTIMAWGTDEQKDRYLTPILSAEEIWCQGFSEPEAGSDLAAVKTRAVRDGDEWVVTGQKVWTSGAQYSKWCMLVARTDPEASKHKGLSYFLMDMEQDAVQVRPLVQITGEAEFNELFIEEARIPHENMLGEEGNGWIVALTTLMNERSGLGFFLQVRLRQLLDKLVAEAVANGSIDDPVIAQALGDMLERTETLRLTAYRGLSTIMKYGQPGPEGSLTKWLWSETNQMMTQLAVDIVGPKALHKDNPWATSFFAPAATRSRAEPPRSSRTSSPSESWDSRGSRPKMEFDFTEDQHEIKRTAKDLLGKRSTAERVRSAAEAGAYEESLWTELVELGWPGVAISEEYGGGGLGVVELATLLEESGYALANSPFLATAACGLAIQEAGSDEQKNEWLPKLASGEATGSFGIDTKIFPDAAASDVIVVVAADGKSCSLVTNTRAVAVEVETIDPTRRYGEVGLGEGSDPMPGDAGAALSLASVLTSAELVGVCARALEMTVEYVKDRKQFDRPVGSFQAVQHRCAQMLLHTEGARSVTYYAAWAADADRSLLEEAAALAKSSASKAGVEVTASAIQAHGGIGFTWEADVHWFYKRAQMDAAYLGGTKTHRAKLTELAAAAAR